MTDKQKGGAAMPQLGQDKIVYHYCSLAAFKNIIENKCLWICDVQKSNDRAECDVLPEAIAAELDRRHPGRPDWPPAGTLAAREYHRIHELLHGSSQSFIPRRVYSISFSRRPDQLSQWRGYADNAAGVCIGFSASHLQQLESYGFTFQPICYTQAQLDDIVCRYADTITAYIDRLAALPDAQQELTAQEHLEVCCEGTDILADIQSRAPLFKKEDFSEENEYRLCFSAKHQAFEGAPVWMSTIDLAPQLRINQSGLFSLGPLRFRTASAGLQSYHELRFDAPGVCDHFIREIIIGPKSLVEIDDLYLFLHSCGYCAVDYEDTSFATLDIRIRKSELTYR